MTALAERRLWTIRARLLLATWLALALGLAPSRSRAEADAGATEPPGTALARGDAGRPSSQPFSRPAASQPALDGGPAPDLQAKLPAWAPQLKETVTPTVVRLGEPVEVEITVRHGQGVSVTLPLQLELGKWTELAREERTRPGPVASKSTASETEHLFTLKLAAYQLGELPLPPIEVSALGPRGELVTLTTTTVPIRVVSVLRNEPNPKLMGLEPTISVFHRTWWLLYTIIAIAGAALVATVTLLLGRHLRRRREAAAPAPPATPAHLIALERLAAIELQSYLAQGRFKELYLLLSEIVRDYLGRRYDFDALEMTTTEISLELIRRVEKGTRERCERYFNDCDLVKFAKYIPDSELARAAYQEAESLVRETAAPAPPAGGAATDPPPAPAPPLGPVAGAPSEERSAPDGS